MTQTMTQTMAQIIDDGIYEECDNWVISKEDITLYIKLHVPSDGDTCSICLEAPPNVSMTICKHTFCKPCISKWISEQNAVCPILSNTLRMNDYYKFLHILPAHLQ